jgi:hypothetical protein
VVNPCSTFWDIRVFSQKDAKMGVLPFSDLGGSRSLRYAELQAEHAEPSPEVRVRAKPSPQV